MSVAFGDADRAPFARPRIAWLRYITWTRFCLLFALASAVALYCFHTWNASLVIDGARWFWLDDDMMISMRYARNLVEGNGLVWNPGERVEGYTNFGWVLIMAAVHLLPLSDQTMAVALRGVSMLICVGMIMVAAQLLRRIESRLLAFTLPAALIGILSCTDVMLWAVSGFETILVTALHLGIVLRAITKREADAPLLVMLALLPVVRGDGMAIWLGDATLVLWLANDRRRTVVRLLATLAPFAAHLLFRIGYYGDVLPNTYYLKVHGLEDRLSRGLAYLHGFVERYALLLVFAIATATSLWRRVPGAISLLSSLVPAALYAVYVGGDSFHPFRFFAHVMPELCIWSAVGAASLVRHPATRTAWLVAPLAVVALPRIANPLQEIVPVGSNGDPFEQVVVAAQLKNNASPDASVAVIPAGIVPYFTRLQSIDLLGKTDRHIARLAPQPGAFIGHGKFEPAYSFALKPDYVISARPRSFADGITPIPGGTTDYVYAILASPEFQLLYKPNPVPDQFLLNHTAVYVRSGSPELDKLKRWWGVVLAP